MTAVPDGQKDLEKVIDDLKRRVHALESAPRASRTGTTGVFAILDDDGNTVCQLDKDGFVQFDVATGLEQVRIGRVFPSPEIFGLEVRNQSGRTTFYRDNIGGALPIASIPWASPNMIAPTGSATFIDLFDMEFYSITDSIKYNFFINPGGGNMDYRIQIAEHGQPFVTAVQETGQTAFVQKGGSFTIPLAALAPGTGTDPVGRFYIMQLEAKKNSGPADVEIRLILPFTNE